MSDLMYPAAPAAEKVDLGLDSVAESSFVSWFHRQGPSPEGTVRLFDRGDFYSAHGQDAKLIASTFFKTQHVLKNLGAGANALPSCTLSMSNGKQFLRQALTSQQLKVQIWGGGTKKSNTWTIQKEASPGNLQAVEDLLFVQSELLSSPIVMALRVRLQDGIKTIGAAFADATNRDLGVAEFAENDLFTNTESLLIQLGVKECLLPSDGPTEDYDLAKLKSVVDRCGCVISETKRAGFSSKSVEQDLNRLLDEASSGNALSEFGLTTSMASMGALIEFLGLLHDESNFGQFRIRTHDLSQYLRLDNSALRALNVFPDAAQTGKNMSVYGLCNHCRTPQGQRLLGQWLKQPLINVHEIRKRHTLVGVFSDDSLRRTIQHDNLRYMPDFLRCSKRLQKGVAGLEDVVVVYNGVRRLPQLMSDLEASEVMDDEAKELVEATFVRPLGELDNVLVKFVDMVETTLDLDELERHNYVIKPEFDPSLEEIRAKVDRVRRKLAKEHGEVKSDLGLDDKVKLEDTQLYGYCFRVTRNDSKVLQKRKGYTELGTNKSGVYFTTRAVKDLCDDYKEFSQEYSRKQNSLVKEVVQIAATYCPPLEQLNVLVATLDVLVSFAHVSTNAPIPYTRPTLTAKGTKGTLSIKAARHPCLEVQDDVHFIPNDTDMVPGESEFLVVTGPNMGGKSTFLRQVGIVALLSQAGCYVPAEEGAQLPVFDCILARVGAGDSQLKGVSTFMAEMLETATILKTATEDSLIIIDELGRGTSTYDGFGLAWAISEWICTKIRCKALFASHFAEITSLASQQPGVKNLHVVAHVAPRANSKSKQDRDITLLYKVEPGVSDRSYGIHVAELANFPPAVIRLAKRKAEELEDFEDADEEDDVNLNSFDPETTKQGAKVVEDFLKAFAQRSKRAKQSVSGQGRAEVLKELKREWQPTFEANAWLKALVEGL